MFLSSVYSGQVLARSTIDRQTTLSPFSLSIQAVNNEGLSCTTMLTITVLSDNNNQVKTRKCSSKLSWIILSRKNIFFTATSVCWTKKLRRGLCCTKWYCGWSGCSCEWEWGTELSHGVFLVRNYVINTLLFVSDCATLKLRFCSIREFVIDKETGQIKILRPLSAQFPTREIVVVANDLGTPRRTAQTTVQVTIRPNCPAVVVTYSVRWEQTNSKTEFLTGYTSVFFIL